MQVSWIDADRLKALVEQIAPQDKHVAAPEPSCAIEESPMAGTTSLPCDFAEIETSDGELGESPIVAARQREVGLEAGTNNHDNHEADSGKLPHAASEMPLSRIRDKLRAIRQRATEAGILTRPADVLPKEEVLAPVEGARVS